MHNEHFGISVVEAMAASTIILSNDSGGPRMDIVKDYEKHCVGYLSITREEYAKTILRIVEEGRTKRDIIRKFARLSLNRFGEAAFEVSGIAVQKSEIVFAEYLEQRNREVTVLTSVLLFFHEPFSNYIMGSHFIVTNQQMNFSRFTFPFTRFLFFLWFSETKSHFFLLFFPEIRYLN